MFAQADYTDAEIPYTRIIEHKHFEYGTQEKTVVRREYSAEWKLGDERTFIAEFSNIVQH